jgi:hypothetical protein
MTELIFDKDETWEKRILCIDESCIGTIGLDGHCRECGKLYDASKIPVSRATVTHTDKTQPRDDLQKSTESTVMDDEWEKRVLCSDESCIGTIGPDGHCRECGKVAK